MGDSITEGTIVDLPVAPGDFLNVDDVVVVLETDKVSVDIRAPHAGALVEVIGEIDDVVEVGSPLFRIDTDADAPEPDSAVPPLEQVASDIQEPPSTSAPAAAAAPPPPVAPAAPAPTPPPPAATSTITTSAGARGERRTKMSRMRQRVASRLKDAQNTAAKYKEEFQQKHGVKLGFMSAFVKASTAALQEIPSINAYMDTESNEIVYHDYCDISVAVASPTGLVVPVLRNTEHMSFADVETNIAMYGQKAKEGKLSLDDMAGGTFTISNGGVFGSLFGTPIINPPQSAILGMHATKMRAVVDPTTGEVVARPMMYMALTYDHRLVDGREGVTFLKSIAEKIADPAKLLLEL